MPTITDQPPGHIQAELDSLRASLTDTIPAKRDQQNLLIATWNIRAFGSLTRKWTAGSNDSPKRDLRAMRTICEIVARFDVVAVQEVVRQFASVTRYDAFSRRQLVVFDDGRNPGCCGPQ